MSERRGASGRRADAPSRLTQEQATLLAYSIPTPPTTTTNGPNKEAEESKEQEQQSGAGEEEEDEDDWDEDEYDDDDYTEFIDDSSVAGTGSSGGRVGGGSSVRSAPSSSSSSSSSSVSVSVRNSVLESSKKLLASRIRVKDKADRATAEQVLDPRTRTMLNKFINNGTLTNIHGCISTGKEANVYYAEAPDGERAVKIYKTSILAFKDRDKYVSGEYRFRHGYCKSNPRKMVRLWAEKEMRNLKRLSAAGIPCPLAIALKHHILIMSFIGSNGQAAPRLKHAELSLNQLRDAYSQVIRLMRQMFHECKLVHADLSEYNLLYFEDVVYVIDVSQSVEHDHPHSVEFLKKDCENMTKYFQQHGVGVMTTQELFEFVFSEDIHDVDAYLSDMQRRIEVRGAVGPSDAASHEASIAAGVFLAAPVVRSLHDLADHEKAFEQLQKQQSTIVDGMALQNRAIQSLTGQSKAQETISRRTTERKERDDPVPTLIPHVAAPSTASPTSTVAASHPASSSKPSSTSVPSSTPHSHHSTSKSSSKPVHAPELVAASRDQAKVSQLFAGLLLPQIEDQLALSAELHAAPGYVSGEEDEDDDDEEEEEEEGEEEDVFSKGNVNHSLAGTRKHMRHVRFNGEDDSSSEDDDEDDDDDTDDDYMMSEGSELSEDDSDRPFGPGHPRWVDRSTMTAEQLRAERKAQKKEAKALQAEKRKNKMKKKDKKKKMKANKKK